MKKLIVLMSGLIIAAGAAAQDRTGSNTAQPAKAGTVDRQAPVKSDSDKRVNPAAEPVGSANTVDPDFQGSSKQETTASGMGQPTTATERTSKTSKTGSDTQDVENKTKQ